jgi:transposase-like protein
MKNPFRCFDSSPEIIRLTVMMYVRYPLSLRQVEDLLFVWINGETHYLWQAADYEGEVLEVFATKRRDRGAALTIIKRAMKRYGRPKVIVTDRPGSYRAAMNVIGNAADQECGHWLNNQAKISYQPFRRRESAVAKFQDVKTLQKFASVHVSIRLTLVEDGQKPYRNLVQRRGSVRDRGIDGQAVTGFEFVGFVAVPVQQLTFKDVDVFGSRVLECGKDFALVGHGHQKGLN